MVKIDLQNDDCLPSIPDMSSFERWVSSALQTQYESFEQTIRIVNEAESRALNHQYRAKDGATNVLAFPAENTHFGYTYLGDLVICAPIVIAEAEQQGKTNVAHWAHMVVHGMLHLQGYDHESDAEAEQMELLEISILSTLGYANPYIAESATQVT